MDFGVSRFPWPQPTKLEPDHDRDARDEELYRIMLRIVPEFSRVLDMAPETDADPDTVRALEAVWPHIEDFVSYLEGRWVDIDGRRSIGDKPLAMQWDHPLPSQWCTRDGKGVVEINEDGTFLAKYRSHYAYGEYLKVIADDQDQFIDFSTLKDAQRRVEQELALI